MSTNSVQILRSTAAPVRRIFASCLALAMVLGLGGPNLHAADRLPESLNDAAITAQVKHSLLFNLLLNTTTQTSQGVVTLGGHADSPTEKALISTLAAAVSGATGVVNNVVILPPL